MPTPQLSSSAYRFIAVGFIVMVSLTVLIIVNTIFSKAVITVTTKASKNIYTTDVGLKQSALGAEALPTSQAPYLSGSIVTATITDSQTLSPNQQGKAIPIKVTGTVTLINSSGQTQPLLKRTQLQRATGGMIYRTDSAVTVPAKGEVTVSVTADNTGKEGEIAPPERLVIIKLNQARQAEVYAEVKSPFSPGEAHQALLNEADISQAKDTLLPSLKEQLVKKLATLSGLNLTEDQVQFGDITLKTDPAVGTEITTFKATGSLAGATVSFKREDLIKNLQAQFYLSLPAGQSGQGFNDNELSWRLKSIDQAGKMAVISASTEVFVSLTPNAQVIETGELTGLNSEQIKARLLENKNVSAVRVSFWPFWRRTAPTSAKKIQIVLQAENNSPETPTTQP